MARILLIEDDPIVSGMVCEGLRRTNHIVECAGDGDQGADLLLHYHYDLAVIDWELPGLQGIEICNLYRAKGGRMPVLFLTALTKVDRKVEALDAGADDYLCKPFSFDELISRVTALLRRPPAANDRFIECGNLKIDSHQGVVIVNGVPVALTAHELEILKLLMSSPNRIFTTAQILEQVSGNDPGGTERSIRQRIMVLRKKLMDEGEAIKTERNIGYRLEL